MQIMILEEAKEAWWKNRTEKLEDEEQMCVNELTCG